jgi:trans-4-hydroxy-L-proline dehydratase
VVEEMRLLQPSSSIQVSKKNPDRFIKRAARIIRTGFGQPSIFNTDLIVQELVRMGKSLRTRAAAAPAAAWRWAPSARKPTSCTGYFNLPKVLEITLHNGVDPRTGQTDRACRPATRATFTSFDQLFAAFERSCAILSKSRCAAQRDRAPVRPLHAGAPSCRC